MSIEHDETTDPTNPTGLTDPTAASGTTPTAAPRHGRGTRIVSATALALGLAVGGGAVASAATSNSTTPSSTSTSPSTSTGGACQPPFGGTPPAAVGAVKSVGSGTFTLTTPDGKTVTVDVGSSTTYLDPGVSSPSIANVTVGAHVAVFGTETSNSVTATKVAIGAPLGAGGPGGFRISGGTPPAAVGAVKSVGSGTFTLTTPDGKTVTVDVGSSTTYLDPGVSSPSIANVTVGAHVAVFGTENSNTVTATKVAIGGPMGPGGPGGFGGPAFGGSTSGSASGSTSGSTSGTTSASVTTA